MTGINPRRRCVRNVPTAIPIGVDGIDARLTARSFHSRFALLTARPYRGTPPVVPRVRQLRRSRGRERLDVPGTRDGGRARHRARPASRGGGDHRVRAERRPTRRRSPVRRRHGPEHEREVHVHAPGRARTASTSRISRASRGRSRTGRARCWRSSARRSPSSRTVRAVVDRDAPTGYHRSRRRRTLPEPNACDYVLAKKERNTPVPYRRLHINKLLISLRSRLREWKLYKSSPSRCRRVAGKLPTHHQSRRIAS